MSRIRLLQRENEALGKQLDTGKIHKLEVELEVCKGSLHCYFRLFLSSLDQFYFLFLKLIINFYYYYYQYVAFSQISIALLLTYFIETIAFLNECKEEDTDFIEQCLKEREQQIENETLKVKASDSSLVS